MDFLKKIGLSPKNKIEKKDLGKDSLGSIFRQLKNVNSPEEMSLPVLVNGRPIDRISFSKESCNIIGGDSSKFSDVSSEEAKKNNEDIFNSKIRSIKKLSDFLADLEPLLNDKVTGNQYLNSKVTIDGIPFICIKYSNEGINLVSDHAVDFENKKQNKK
ncbi:MAG: hypothetical protein WCO35_00910 [Candidatus Nomurabacteria bacterium]